MENQDQRRKYILIGLVVFLCLIIFSIGSYYLGRRSNKTSVPTTSQKQSQTSNDNVTPATNSISSSLKTGQRVRILVDTPAGVPVDGIIRVIQDVPGKKIGVELDKFTNYAHSLDRLVEEGKGWWTLEENIKVL